MRKRGGVVLIWLFATLGTFLLAIGFWGYLRPWKPAKRAQEAQPETEDQAAPEDAWQVLTRPLIPEEELIEIPDDRPWYLPGPDRPFMRGLLMGLGGGLLLSAFTFGLLMRKEIPVPRVAAPSPPPVIQKEEKPTPTPPATAPRTPVPAPRPASIPFVVEEGEAAGTIAARLKAAGLIPSEEAFLQRVAALGAEDRLKAGRFTLTPGDPIDQIIWRLSS